MDKRPVDIYTLEGLAWLEQEFARKQAQWESYAGNNPNKGAAERRSLRREIELVTTGLKERGLISLTAEEILKNALDAKTPSRMKGCCAEMDGQWYKIKFTGKNERGLWEWTWMPVSLDEVNGPGGYIHPGPKRPIDGFSE